MGARIALQAMLIHNAPFASLTCLSASLKVEDAALRTSQEETWLNKLESSSIVSFVNYWYKMPIFSGFSFPHYRYMQEKEGLIHCLQQFSILGDEPILDLIHSSNKLSFIYKKNDPKAASLQDFPNVYYVDSPHHSIHLQSSKECMQLLQSFK